MVWNKFSKAAWTVAAVAMTATAGAQTFRVESPQTEGMLRSATTPSPQDFAHLAAATNPFVKFQPVSVSKDDITGTGESSSVDSTDALPEAPVPGQQTAAPVPRIEQPLQGGIMMPQDPPKGHEPKVAHTREKYIPAGFAYHHLTAGDKVYLGFRDLYSVGNFGAMFLSAGYEHLTNGAPNYGTDKGAFGARLGAAGIRETSEGLFTDAVFAPLFREDPRYFVEGPTHPFVKRAFHVVTRVFITRTDSGTHTINKSLLVGYAASTALQSAYYPQINRNAKDAASEYAGSLGGAALGFAFDEFADQVLQALHLQRKP